MLDRINSQGFQFFQACDDGCDFLYAGWMDSQAYEKFMQIVRDSVKKHGGQQGVAEATGVPQSTISKILNGKGVTLETLCRMLDGLKARIVGPDDAVASQPCAHVEQSELAQINAMVFKILYEHDVDGAAITAVQRAILGIEEKRHKQNAVGDE